MKDIIFPFYEADIHKAYPLGYVSLDYVLNSIKNPKNNIKHIFEEIELCQKNNNMKRKQELKEKLYSFNPCVYIEGKRCYDNIKRFTGLLMLDFDKLPTPEYCEELKQHIFNDFEFVIAAWLSASKHGVRAVVSIPICSSPNEFKHYFNAIELQFGQYKGFDKAPKNCALPLFISYDPLLLMRDDYSTWTQKVIPVERPPVVQYIVTDKTSSIEKIIIKRIDTITDSGHTILRATAYLLGGFVGAGYIGYDHSIHFINQLIDGHHYLRQKAWVYKKTAKTMIDKGINVPAYLDK